MSRTLVTLSSFFAAGVAIGLIEERSSLFVLSFFTSTLFLLIVFLLAKKKGIKTIYVQVLVVIFIGLTLGTLRGGFYEEVKPNKAYLGRQELLVEVIEPSVQKDSIQTFKVRLKDNEDVYFQITTPPYPLYKPGMILLISGEVREGEALLPTKVNQKSFDYQSYLALKKITGTIFYPRIEVKENTEDRFMYTLFSIKEKSLNTLSHHIPFPESALVAGVLLGVDSLPKENKDAMRVSSLTHITVLSGFNIAIISGAVLSILRFAPLFVRIVLSSTLIGIFVLMVGGGSSLVRATIMGYVALLALSLGRRYDALSALFFALLLYLIITPQALLYDVSLLLSFFATLGIIVLYEPIEFYIKPYLRYEVVTAIVSATIAVMVYTTPFIIYTFGAFSLYGILSNVVVLPAVPLLMLFGFLTIVSAPLSFIASCFAFLSYALASFIIGVSTFISAIPLASIDASISSMTLIGSYVLIVLLTIMFIRNVKEKQDNGRGVISF